MKPALLAIGLTLGLSAFAQDAQPAGGDTARKDSQDIAREIRHYSELEKLADTAPGGGKIHWVAGSIFTVVELRPTPDGRASELLVFETGSETATVRAYLPIEEVTRRAVFRDGRLIISEVGSDTKLSATLVELYPTREGVWEGSSEDDFWPRKLKELDEQYLDGNIAEAREALDETIEIFATDPFFEDWPEPRLSLTYGRLYCVEYAAGREAEAYLACQYARFYGMKALERSSLSPEERATESRRIYDASCEDIAPWRHDQKRTDGRGPAYGRSANRVCGDSFGAAGTSNSTP
jgi:hypothetical protein